jgi:hypothetical protein
MSLTGNLDKGMLLSPRVKSGQGLFPLTLSAYSSWPSSGAALIWNGVLRTIPMTIAENL